MQRSAALTNLSVGVGDCPPSWPPIGALPRNRLASSATGGASPISPMTRMQCTPCSASVGRGAPPRRDTRRTLKKTTLSLRTSPQTGVAIRNPFAPHSQQCTRKGRRLLTVVPTDSRPLTWPPIGALPRNRLASSATGGASPISPTTRMQCTPLSRTRRAGCPHPAADKAWHPYVMRRGRRPRRPVCAVPPCRA